MSYNSFANSVPYLADFGNDVNEITRLKEAGNSSVKINYTANDYNPAKGINYYLLKQVDLDGRFTYSEIRSVFFGSDVNVVVALNPAKDKVTVYLPGNSSTVLIEIINARGQLAKRISTKEESISIHLTGFSKGMYSMKVKGKNINEVKQLLVE